MGACADEEGGAEGEVEYGHLNGAVTPLPFHFGPCVLCIWSVPSAGVYLVGVGKRSYIETIELSLGFLQRRGMGYASASAEVHLRTWEEDGRAYYLSSRRYT